MGERAVELAAEVAALRGALRLFARDGIDMDRYADGQQFGLTKAAILKARAALTTPSPRAEAVADVVQAADAFVAGDEAGGGHEVNFPNYMRLKKAVRRYRMAPLPTRVELAGSDPDFTGDLTTEDYMREVRDDG